MWKSYLLRQNLHKNAKKRSKTAQRAHSTASSTTETTESRNAKIGTNVCSHGLTMMHELFLFCFKNIHQACALIFFNNTRHEQCGAAGEVPADWARLAGLHRGGSATGHGRQRCMQNGAG